MNESTSASHPISQGRAERRQQRIQALRRPADHLRERLADERVDLPDDEVFGAVAVTLRDRGHDFAAHAHQAGIDAGKKRGIKAPASSAPHCQDDARFVSYRTKTWLTCMGEVFVRRAYYHCSNCHLCILDWYHASQDVHDHAKTLHPRDAACQAAWAKQAKDILYEQGGTALLVHLREQAVPVDAEVAEELRKLIGYVAGNEHRMDYPRYRSRGWDIGSGPTEAACKVVGVRLKGSGMRWLEGGAAQVAPLRALYQSGTDVWDAFWAMAA